MIIFKINQYTLQGRCICVDTGSYDSIIKLLRFLVNDDKDGQYIFETTTMYVGEFREWPINLTVDEIYEVSV